jgi:2-hydroxycyclohexanecarboxyl-CoA dehydrogenase
MPLRWARVSMSNALDAWNDQRAPAQRRSYDDWADDKVRAVVLLARCQQPEDVADMVAFLASIRAAQVIDRTINVDGGQVMHS